MSINNSNYYNYVNKIIMIKKKVKKYFNWLTSSWSDVWSNIKQLQTNDQCESISTFGSGLGIYADMCLAPNGMIYASPYGAGKILKINPNTDTYTTIGSGLSSYYDTTLAPNGMIYAVPFGVGNILKINPNNCTLNTDPKKALLSPYVNEN